MSSQVPSIPSKVFSALSGEEVKKIVLKQVEAAFDSDENFMAHLTYPVVEGDFVFKMRSYPSRGDTLVVKASVRAEAEGPLPELDKPFESTLTGSFKTDTPDQTRQEHGLPITRPEMRNGRFVDVASEEVPELPTIGMPEIEA